ncbi:MAG: competence/damage-inducible protein A [Bilophila sp.]
MNAEIISVGTELLLGHTINTDAAFVARELSAIGVNLLYACTVGDNAGRLRAALEEALGRSDVVITTGGLGPTDDDLTKETIAAVAGVPLALHEDSLRRLEEYFRGRPPMGENQRKQAMLPEGCTPFPNDIGTAPGCGVRTAAGKIIIMLPGPPSELVPMLQRYVVPFLSGAAHAVIHSSMIRTFGLGEGSGALKIADSTDAANPTAATYAKENEMFVRVTARAESEEEAEALCRPVVEEICRRYGDVVYGVDVENLESVVVALLRERGLRLATAESCTGGLVAKRITDVPGASDVFGTGFVTYANDAKTRLLGVAASLLEAHGAVSEPVARAMAEGARKASGSDLGIGITGVAGPGGGTPEKPVGLIYIALSAGDETFVRRMTPPGRIHGRGWLRERAASTALDMVRRYLCDLPLEPAAPPSPATPLGT